MCCFEIIYVFICSRFIHPFYSKCITEEQCTNNLDGTVKGNWFIFNNTCTDDCPQNYYKGVSKTSNKTTCIYCGSQCVKNCTVKEPLESMSDAEKLQGCTRIDGSLVITLNSDVDIGELTEYLGSVKYIRDGLVIARTMFIKNLNFLTNLNEIEGKNLSKRYALLVYENQNLQHLWNFSDPTFKLKIRNGK